MEIDAKVWQTGQFVATSATCCEPILAAQRPSAPPPPGGTVHDLSYFGYGQFSGSELKFYSIVADLTLRDPVQLAQLGGNREFRFAIDADNNIATGDPTSPLCGADCYVSIKQISDGSTITTGSTLWCWTCCPGEPPHWVLSKAKPYAVFLGNKLTTAMVKLRDVGNPAGAMAAWSVLYVNGTPASTSPSDVCSERLQIVPQPDIICPWIPNVEVINAVAATVAEPVYVNFSEPMRPISVSDIVLTPAVPFTVSLDVTERRLAIAANNVSGRFPPGRYQVTVLPSVKDLAGNPLDGNQDFVCGDPYTFTFCVPDLAFHPTDGSGVIKDVFGLTDPIYVEGDNFTPGIYRLYLVNNDDVDVAGGWLVDQSDNGPTTVGIGLSRILPVTFLGRVVGAGEYNVVLDINGDGRYQPGIDRIMNPCETGLLAGTNCNSTLDDLVATWPFDEVMPAGPVAELMEANHGSIIGSGSSSVAGVVNRARHLGGAVYIQVPDAPDLNFNTGDFSIECWIRTSAGVGEMALVDKRSAGGSFTGYYLHFVNGRLSFVMAGVPSVGLPVASSYGGVGPSVADGQWHHVAVSVARESGAPAAVRLYVDGAQVFSSTAPVLFDTGNAAELRIGGKRAGDPPLCFTGDIDELSLYEKALSPSEVRFVFTQRERGKCTDGLCPPFIGDQPNSLAVVSGQTAMFSISTYGDGLEFQWRKNGASLADGGRITGALTRELTINPTAAGDAGLYDVVVTTGTNNCGSVTSAPVTLTLTSPVLNISRAGSNVVLTWSALGYRLQCSTSLNGPWADVPGASSPFTVTLSGTQKYFRLVYP